MSDLDDDSFEASETDSDHAAYRPNRWHGAPSTWASYTEEERGLAASLDMLRNEDLSVHLYNAHALNRRARDIERGETVEEFPGVPTESQAWRPPKTWTAWPLPPDEVPRSGEQVGPGDSFEGHTFKREEDGAPSRELEDVLTGVVLKFAKERFESRESAGEDEKYEGKGKGRVILEDDADSTGSEYLQSSSDGNGGAPSIIKEGPGSPPANIRMKPVVSADEESSRVLLRPSIRHTLSKLDEVLMALHHARKACYKYSHSEAGITDEESTLGNIASEQTPPSKKARGRPRRFANLPERSKPPEPQVEELDQADLLKTRKKKQGRPIKLHERLEGETQEDYLVRIAKLQKRPLPVFALLTEPKHPKSPSPNRTRKRSSPRNRINPGKPRFSRQRKLGLRDWSEVLGAAALVGFPDDVVERATRRCANLFGEGMDVRRMMEVPFSEREAGHTLTRYEPQLIPAFDDNLVDTPSSSGSDSDSEPDMQPTPRSSFQARKYIVFCPVPDCQRRKRGFVDTNALKRHLEAAHNIAKEEVADWILPSDEEMEGAVHVDGFLRPVKRVRGMRGKYRSRKGREVALEEEEGEEEEQMVERGAEGESEETRSEQAESSDEESRSSVSSYWA
ncbi:RNA polymerase I specific transcription initiation factor [Diplocarpon rosae]|nr:RNA polymerase I specific transcription initiation factor [Diplocarpon rosae]